MIKNAYRIIVLNDKTRFNKSFVLYFKTLCLFFSLLLIMLAFTSFGIYRLIKPHPEQNEFNLLWDNQNNIINFLNHIQKSGLIDSTILNNYQINKFYFSDSNHIPNYLPVKGIVTRGIDLSGTNPHNGLDIAAKFNNPVYPAQDGLVIFTGLLNNLGNTVMISHPHNFITLYSHLNKIFVKQREYVKTQDKIGTIGESGNSNGPHLHFEIWQNSNIIDPRSIIKEYKLNDVSIEENK